MSKTPEWLSQVKQLSVEVAAGQSDIGAALSALADEMVPVKSGDVIAAAIDRVDQGTEFAVLVSSGDVAADVARLTEKYEVHPSAVVLMSAADMIEQQYNGVATCSTFF